MVRTSVLSHLPKPVSKRFSCCLCLVFPRVTPSTWCHAAGGLALALVQFFYVKYLVLFGLPSMLATLDRLSPPALPRCVSTMHSFTGMWRWVTRTQACTLARTHARTNAQTHAHTHARTHERMHTRTQWQPCVGIIVYFSALYLLSRRITILQHKGTNLIG